LRIGIGVSSYRRPLEATETCRGIIAAIAAAPYTDVHTLCSLDDENSSGYEWISENFGLTTAPNGGVAANKNRLLRHFLRLDCDVVFLIEDDLLIRSTGWIDQYISALEQTGWGHLTWLAPDYRNPLTDVIPLKGMKICVYGHEVNGIFMVMTRECLRRVGRFDEEYGRYGAEHVDYSRRCYHAGLYPNRHPHIQDADDAFALMPCGSCIPVDEKDRLINAALIRLADQERARMAGRAAFYLPL
jgi:GT2 family glycosyltransferase